MSRRFRRGAGTAVLLGTTFLLGGTDASGARSNEQHAIETVARLVGEVRAASFPALQNSQFRYEPLDSSSDFLQTRFTAASFFLSPSLEYLIMVNPKLKERNVPAGALRSILAHELAHAEYFQTHSQFELLGLVRLLSSSFTARFERSADLMAIGRGYGPGLKQYREWLYPNVPHNSIAEKRRDYYMPDEIDAIDRARSKDSAIMDRLNVCVPLTMWELKAVLANAVGTCSGTAKTSR